MKMQKILSLILILLLATSVTVPVVSAEPAPLVAAPVVVVTVPEVANVVVLGVTYIISGTILVKIGEDLGIKWDRVTEKFDDFASSVGKKLSNIISNGEWIDTVSPNAKAVLTLDYRAAIAGSGGKKDDKLYHKAERDEATGKVKINTERISEEDAAKELKEGRDIFTVTKELAENVMDRAFGKGSERILENHGSKDGRYCKKGYYDHYHPKNQPVRPHCWIWDTI